MANREPGRRSRIEAELGASLMMEVRRFCRLAGVNPDRWQHVPALRTTFETLAVLRRAERLQQDRAMSETRAIDWAAAEMGLSGETIRRALTDWRRRVREEFEHSLEEAA